MQQGAYVQVLKNITSQYPYYTFKILIFTFCKCVKKVLRYKKIKKTIARYENSTNKLVLKSCQTFAENYFIKLIVHKIDTFYVSAVHYAILTYQKNFFVIATIWKLPNCEKLESPKMILYILLWT